MYTKKLPELLAPAGDFECLSAAVAAGADAVYFGCKKYNARAFAGNFEGDVLKKAFDLCRLHNVRVYLTFNTLCTQKDFEEILAYSVNICNTYRPDGAIVQDLGLAKRLHESTGVPIVASTQMALHSQYGSDVLKSIGVFRTVCAREMTLEEVTKMQKESGLEAELFVHGAICVCQSGGCLMSSMIGKRSGNQGACAQPCRLPYKSGYSLSLKDMCLAKHIPEIIDAGVSSLKIEGRMKDAKYVYGVVSVYRRLLDERRSATKKELDFLKSLFSRSGFTDAYFTGDLCIDMFGVRTENDKENSKNTSVVITQKKLPVKIAAEFCKDLSKMTASCFGVEVTVYGSSPLVATGAPMSESDVRSRLSKVGDTEFCIDGIDVSLSEGLFMPVSTVNALRRDCLDALAAKIIKSNTPEYTGREVFGSPAESTFSKKPMFSVRLCTSRLPDPDIFRDFADKVLFFDIPLWQTDLLEKYAGVFGADKIRAMLPRCVYPTDKDGVSRLIEKAKNAGISSVLCSSFAQKDLCDGMKLYADYTANVANTESMRIYRDAGFSGVFASAELRQKGIGALSGITGLSLSVYGRLTLMHTRCCIIESIRCKKCARKVPFLCTEKLSDRTGADFPVAREYSHRNNIYNSVPLWLLDKGSLIDSLGVDEKCLIFTTESDSEIRDVLYSAINQKAPDVKVTRAYF